MDLTQVVRLTLFTTLVVSLVTATTPLVTASGVNAGGSDNPNTPYKAITAATTFKVFVKATANATSPSSAADGLYISDADVDAGRKGYLVVEVCYLRADTAPGYADIEQYLTNRTVS